VLALDKGGWLGKRALVDAYTAGRSSNKAVGVGSGGGVKPNNKSPKLVPRVYYPRSSNQGEPPQAGQKS